MGWCPTGGVFRPLGRRLRTIILVFPTMCWACMIDWNYGLSRRGVEMMQRSPVGSFCDGLRVELEGNGSRSKSSENFKMNRESSFDRNPFLSIIEDNSTWYRNVHWTLLRWLERRVITRLAESSPFECLRGALHREGVCTWCTGSIILRSENQLKSKECWQHCCSFR